MSKRKELAPIISNFLFHSVEDPKDEQREYVELKIKIREYLAHKTFRKIISQILFDLQKDVAGGARLRLFKLYKELELHHDSFKKLESWRWENVAQGILELSDMEVSESYLLIRKFVNDRRGLVRKQAELATVALREEGIDYLLDTTKQPISEWQQLKLIEILGKKQHYRPPQFKSWLLSQNKDVVLFALRLIKHYNQKGAESSINQLMMHKNSQIKIAAIQCAVDFHFKSALISLKKVFWKSTDLVKINILNAVAELGGEDELLFLKEVAQRAKSFVIVGKAQSVINAILPESILPTKDILQLTDEEIKENDQAETDSVLDLNDELMEMVFKMDVQFQTVEPPPPASIEVEDLEFYDEIEIPSKAPKTFEPLETSEEHPVFEINTVHSVAEDTIETHLGLVESQEERQQDGLDLSDSYEEYSQIEKSTLLGGIDEANDEKEVAFLEHMAENESDPELRFMAFKKLKFFRKGKSKAIETQKVTKSEELPLGQQSIFYSLFHHATDLNARCILIAETVYVGDEKELAFLQSLESHENKVIANKAKAALGELRDRITTQTSSASETVISETRHTEEKMATEAAIEPEERIPMELFPLYEELAILPPKETKNEPLIFDFELSEEFFEVTTNKQSNNEFNDQWHI